MLETSAAYSRQAAEDGEEESKLKKKKNKHTRSETMCFRYMCDSNSIPFAFAFR